MRADAGMPKTELSRISGVRRQTYTELRYTTRQPRRDIVLALASAVEMDTMEAIALAGLNPVDSDTVRRTILDAADLNTEQKNSLLALLSVYEAEDAEAAPVLAGGRARSPRALDIVRVA